MKLYIAFKMNKEFKSLKLLYLIILKNRILFNNFKLKIYLYYKLLL